MRASGEVLVYDKSGYNAFVQYSAELHSIEIFGSTVVVREALRISRRCGVGKVHLMFGCFRRSSEWCHGCIECAVLEDLLVNRFFRGERGGVYEG
jgi:hypothetical protein